MRTIGTLENLQLKNTNTITPSTTVQFSTNSHRFLQFDRLHSSLSFSVVILVKRYGRDDLVMKSRGPF
ncbi:hypothetical protein AKJ16_DCAP02887 [Drosera capensis]